MSLRLSIAPTLALLCVLSAGCADEPLHPFFTKQKRPIIFAHRGGGGIEPEATIRTIQSTMAAYPDQVIEFDVHRTKDDQIVVIHDDSVDRTTNGAGRVAALTVAELKMLDAGYCATPNKGNGTAESGECHGATDAAAFPFRGAGYQIPTLAEVLDVIPRDRFISIELKTDDLEQRVAQILRDQGRLEHTVVGSEHDDAALKLLRALPMLPHFMPEAAATCFAFAAKIGNDYVACPNYEVFAAPTSAKGLSLDTTGMINAAHARGMAVVYWTINEEAEMDHIFRIGADGIFTDYPDRAARVLARLRAEGAVP